MNQDMLLKTAAAGVVLAVFGGFFLFKFVVGGQSLQSEGVRVIEHWLKYEPQRADWKDLKAFARGDWTDEEVGRRASAIPFEIVSVRRHGWNDRYVVRVELRYPEGAPPGTPSVRYFRMRYSAARGWRLTSETGALNYYLALIP